MASRRDFAPIVLQGEDITLRWGATDVNLTGAAIVFRLSAAGVENLLEKSCEVTAGPAGEFQVVLTAANLNLRPSTFRYETRRTSGDVRTLFFGMITISDSLFVSP
jgi:hypothetical protein